MLLLVLVIFSISLVAKNFTPKRNVTPANLQGLQARHRLQIQGDKIGLCLLRLFNPLLLLINAAILSYQHEAQAYFQLANCNL